MRIALALLLVCGCNQIFGLEAGSGDDDSAGDGDGGDRDGPPPDSRPDDLDSDGVLDGVDNCPRDYNPRQADEDTDAEVNGGDVCDPCPHLGAGQPHADTDGDGLGDECDPDNAVWHCLRWFDGFSDAADDIILARYTINGGVWGLNVGYIVQSDALAENAELSVIEPISSSPLVDTRGRMEVLPTTGPAGQMPYRNAAGVLLVAGSPGCFASVTRDVTNGVPSTAEVALSSRNGAEIVNASSQMGIVPVSMIVGERFGATLDALSLPDQPLATVSLYERGATNSVGAQIICAPGGGGLRTSFAAIRFEYLLIVERGTTGTPCPTRLPVSGPVD